MPLIRELGLPEHLFGELLEPGTVRGILCPEVAAEVGLSPGVKVVAVGSHGQCRACCSFPQGKGGGQCFSQFRHVVVAGCRLG